MTESRSLGVDADPVGRTDEVLLRLAQGGDRPALEAFWERRSGDAYRLALIMTGCEDLAREALQELWIAMASSLERFDPGKGNARTWLMGILRNKVRHLVRGRRRWPLSLDLPVSGPGSRVLGDFLASPAEVPETAAARKEETRRLLEALETLDPALREAVAGHWILGFGHAELAEALDISPEAARQRAHRGLLALRAVMKKG